MTTRACRYCGEEQDLETGFSRNGYARSGRQRYHWTCKKCWSRIRTKPAKPPEPGVPKEWLDDVDRIRPVTCTGKSASLEETGKCIHFQCRYHMIDMVRNGRFHGGMTDEEIVAEIMTMGPTCLWEVMEKFDTPLTLEQIADILGVSKQRADQMVNEALESMKKKAGHLEVCLEDEVDLKYRKPERVIGTERISDRKIVPQWHPNFVSLWSGTKSHDDLSEK